MRTPTGHRVAAVAERLSVHPISSDGVVPVGSMCAISKTGDVYDLADVFEALVTKIEYLEREVAWAKENT